MSMAPFGVPVVPPVYCRAIRSSFGLISTLGRLGCVVSTSCLKLWTPVSFGILWLGTFPISEPMMRFKGGRYSPIVATIRFLSLILSSTALTIGESTSRKMSVSAPESWIWCSSSLSLYSGLMAVLMAPSFDAA